jgi:hypothetical protein
VVGACEVDLAGDVGEGAADADADQGVAELPAARHTSGRRRSPASRPPLYFPASCAVAGPANAISANSTNAGRNLASRFGLPARIAS